MILKYNMCNSRKISVDMKRLLTIAIVLIFLGIQATERITQVALFAMFGIALFGYLVHSPHKVTYIRFKEK